MPSQCDLSELLWNTGVKLLEICLLVRVTVGTPDDCLICFYYFAITVLLLCYYFIFFHTVIDVIQ